MIRFARTLRRADGRRVLLAALAVAALGLAAGCGKSPVTAAPTTGSASASATSTSLVTTTPPAANDVDSVTWALYRDPTTLDPIMSFDYPENTVISVLCDALQRQHPDGSVGPGLATLTYKTPTEIVLALRSGVHFWDGAPLTPADVVYSLDRNRDPTLAGFYPLVFTRVKSIAATGPMQVTITLSQPDYWLQGELSSMPGMVVEKRFVEEHGAKFGSPSAGTMCTGPFEVGSWKPGQALTVVRNDQYWDTTLRARTREIRFVGIPDIAALTSGLLTGEVDGTYLTDTSTLRRLEQAPNLQVFHGPSFDTDVFIVTKLSGTLGDERVRQALSLAFDRQSYIDTVYAGAAQVPHMPTNPGTWGYARDVFRQAWDSMPPLDQNIAKAKQLIRAAGAVGKEIVIGTSTDLSQVQAEASAWQAAAQSIGLKASLYNVSADNYINFFTDPNARKPIDAMITTTYGDYADPTSLEATYVLRGGVQNYDDYSDPRLTRLFGQAQGEADPAARAKIEVAAERIMMRTLPWIPVSDPETLLVLGKRFTGPAASFSYMAAPWLGQIGAR